MKTTQGEVTVRHPFLLGSLALIAAAATDHPVGGADPVYHSTRKGDVLVYQVTLGGRTREYTQTTTGVEAKDGVRRVEVRRDFGGGRTTADTFEVAEGALRQVSLAGQEFDPPLVLLKAGARPKDSWTWEAKGREGKPRHEKLTVTLHGEEEVRVPAGAYPALRVETSAAVDERKPTGKTYWFAPGVGVVKMVARTGESEAVVVLKSYSPAK